MNQQDNILKILRDINESLDEESRDVVLSSTTQTQSILERFYSVKSPYFIDLARIRTDLMIICKYGADKAPIGAGLSKIKLLYHRLLETMINEISLLGIPSSSDIKIDRSINLSVNQNQEQTQQLNLTLDIIKDEITGNQYKELIEIIKSSQNQQKTKPEIIKKLKEFGEDVCIKVVTNILTSPTLLETLFK